MVEPAAHSRVVNVFARVVRLRWWIVVLYALLIPGAVVLALRVPNDSGIENMVVSSDPDVRATREFQRIFAERPLVLLLVENEHAFSAEAIAGARALESAVGRVGGVRTYSVMSTWTRMRPDAAAGPEAAADLAKFATGTRFFRDQGLAGDDFLGIVAVLDVSGPKARDEALGGIDRAIAQVSATPVGRAGIRNVRRVGEPWLNSWLEQETNAATLRYFPLFGVFVVLLTIGLYRTWRALVAILLSLGVAVLLGMAFAGLVGFGFTIVSALVPLVVMITVTASLVYLHSRFVDQPPGIDLETHRLMALGNKLVAVSASMFAAAVGFAAMAVSRIRPIRELGVWTAGALAVGWVVCFTLYPALQVILRTPTRRDRPVSGGWMVRVAEVLPRWSYRWRWALLAPAAVLAASGLVALFGLPGIIAPMRLGLNSLDYVDPSLPIARDTRAFAAKVVGLTNVSVWITTPPEAVLDPQVLAGLNAWSTALREDGTIGAVVGLTDVLRLRRYSAGQGDSLPSDPAEFARATSDLEQLVLQEPELRQWVDLSSLGSTYVTVTSRAGDQNGIDGLRLAVATAWERATRSTPVLAKCSYKIVGTGALESRINAQLVPTLVQSFAITFGIIFVTFLLVFRNGPARLIAIVPSLFAILVMFLVMRLTGIQLNVATILIATTVLGATENDQIHFFYHFQERRNGGTTEQSLSHSIRIAGHAIVFATVINAGGFLALIASSLPPMRQFGLLTATAFALAMLADFTALPAALWVIFRERPDGARQ
jgi:predicted RND superfamily exporter protein